MQSPMREWNATQSILIKALQQARDSNAKYIRTIRLAIGEISELDPDSIRQHWVAISQGTPGEQAQLSFRWIQAELQCMACFEKYHPMDAKIHCPHCGSYGAKVLAGEEFFLESVELES